MLLKITKLFFISKIFRIFALLNGYSINLLKINKMNEMMLTGFGFESSSKIKPNVNFDKPVNVVFIDESDRIDTCNLPE